MSTVTSRRATFEATGVLRLDGALDPVATARIRDAVWSYAGRKIGLRRDDPSTWPPSGRVPISWKGLKRNPAFSAVNEAPPVREALEAVFGRDGWEPPKAGAQVLLTLPQEGPWTLPDAWHMDCGFERPSWPVFAVKLFVFLDTVGPCGGGTMLLPGTPALVDRYRGTIPPGTGGGMVEWRRFLRSDPWLAELLRAGRAPDGGRSLVGARHEVEGVPVEVVELTGEPGDVVLTHLHVLHSAAPNTSAQPRQMLGKAVLARRPQAPPAKAG